MERDRLNDPNLSGKNGGDSLEFDANLILRLGASIMGGMLILTGMILAIIAFTVIRGIIESPDTFVANIDGWRGAKPEVVMAEPVTVPPIETLPAEPETTQGEIETSESASEVEDSESADEPEATVDLSEEAEDPASTDMIKNMTSERDDTSVVRYNRTPVYKSDTETFIEEVLELIRDGGMGRVIGAIFLLLFTALLAHIPVLLIRVGVQLLAATAKVKMPVSK